jgi:Protein of unknown function (DUF2505)
MQFVVEIVVRGIDYPTFRRVYYSAEFNDDVAQAAKLKERGQLEHVTLPDGRERRRVRVVPRVALPGPVQKILNGETISYEETTVFDPATRSATFSLESTAADAVQVTGVARFLEEDGGVRLRFEGEAKVKVFGVGGLAERYIVGEVRSRYEIVARLMQQFVDEGRDRTTTPLVDRGTA